MDKPLIPLCNQIKKPPDRLMNSPNIINSANKSISKNAFENNCSIGSGSVSDNVNTICNPQLLQYPLSDSGTSPESNNCSNVQRKESFDMEFQNSSLDQINQQSSGDGINFEVVKNKKYKRNSNGAVKIDLASLRSVDTNITPSCSQNRFAVLENLTVEPNLTKSVKNNPITKKPKNTKQFCPPIFLYGVNIKSLVEQLKVKCLDFKIVNKSNIKSKLYLKDVAAHTEMMQLLREKNIESYSFTPSELRRQSLVLRGLYYDSNLSDIESDLNNLVPGAIQSVSKFKTSFSKKKKTIWKQVYF